MRDGFEGEAVAGAEAPFFKMSVFGRSKLVP
jgi:hypothetical protein